MPNHRFVLASLLLLMFATPSSGQKPPQHEQVQALKPFIGDWEGAFDPPGEMPAGTLEVSFRWMGNESYVLHEVYFRAPHFPEGKRMNPEFVVIGFDHGDQETKSWHFHYDKQGRMSAKISKNRIFMHQQRGGDGTGADESQSKLLELTDDNTLRMVESSHAGGDDEPARERITTLRRVR